MEHQPVMLEPVLHGLDIEANGNYIDGTFGRGGHSKAILAQLNAAGRLYAIDRDLAAIASAQQQYADESRFAIAHGSFEKLAEFSQGWDIMGNVQGILLDLGVSSPQLDDPGRGFSFMHDGPLDMRMDNSQGLSAQEWLAKAEAAEIADVLWQYGEERFSRRIAKHIVAERDKVAITSTTQLALLIKEACPKVDKHKHPATRSFQAIRIFINQELEALKHVLLQCLDVLAQGGRLVVISFHSLEDRLVKRFFREQSVGKQLPRGLPVMGENEGRRLRLHGRAIKPSDTEVQRNPRARSAVLRIAEKL